MSDQGIVSTRRAILAAGAGLAAMGAFAGRAAAQGDTLLARVEGARRILHQGRRCAHPRSRSVGDFAQADVLIEDGKISAVRPDIAAGDAAVVDAANRIVMPGFIDTHHHFYQGILRNILSNGLLNPDYSRDISNALTAPYRPADVYAGTLISALGMIDMGTTAAVDTSQVNHTPEHSDAGVRALQESGLRVVYAYSRGAGPDAQYPQDLTRLQKDLFQLGGPAADARARRQPRRPACSASRASRACAWSCHRRQGRDRAGPVSARSRQAPGPGRRIHPLHASDAAMPGA